MSNWGFQLVFDVDSPTRNLDRFDAELTHVGLTRTSPRPPIQLEDRVTRLALRCAVVAALDVENHVREAIVQAVGNNRRPQ